MARGRLFVDLSPLREHREFKKLWWGYLVSSLGSELTVVAVPFQVYRLTGSSLQVGLVSLAQLGPILLGSFGGGVIADALDRRRLLLFTSTALGLSSGGLALNAFLGHPVLWPIYVCAAFAAGVSGIDSPTRSALVFDLVPTTSFIKANALWQLLGQFGAVIGPALGGLLIARFNLGPVYLIDVATFVVALGTAFVLRAPSRSPTGTFELSELVGGLRYLRNHVVLQMSFFVDLDAMIFGMPSALFPALGVGRFHGGAATVGLLYAAPGAGALLGGLLSGWVAMIVRQGRAVVLAVLLWGVAIIGFGLCPALGPALALLSVAGAADVFSAVFRNTILSNEAPARLQGRLQAVKFAVVTGGPRLGDIESGGVASAFGPVTSVVSGGVACLVGLALLLRAVPGFARYRAPIGGHASDELEQEEAVGDQDV